MIHSSIFGKTADGSNVMAFRIKDGVNEAVILSMGGIVQSLRVADKRGYPVDVVLGYNDIASYERSPQCIGGIVGRCANRIENGHMCIDGVDYDLYKNDGGHHLHGGNCGFDKKLWNYVFEGSDGNTLALSMASPDGDENYPGNLNVQIRYSLVDGELRIEYAAMADRKTVINMTNQISFNLNGEAEGDVLDHMLTINADKITPTDDALIPHGSFRNVGGTPFDFRTPHKVGERIGETSDPDIARQGGYDVNYLLNKRPNEFVKAAEVSGEQSGITMEVLTNKPALQLYTYNRMDTMGKSGHYGAHAGLCLETQFIPNAVNCPSYAMHGDPVYDKNKIYHFATTYKFSHK